MGTQLTTRQKRTIQEGLLEELTATLDTTIEVKSVWDPNLVLTGRSMTINMHPDRGFTLTDESVSPPWKHTDDGTGFSGAGFTDHIVESVIAATRRAPILQPVPIDFLEDDAPSEDASTSRTHASLPATPSLEPRPWSYAEKYADQLRVIEAAVSSMGIQAAPRETTDPQRTPTASAPPSKPRVTPGAPPTRMPSVFRSR